MIIRDNTAKSGDPHERKKARSNGEELKMTWAGDMTEDEQKIFRKTERPACNRTGREGVSTDSLFFICQEERMLKDRGGCAMIGEERESVWTGTGYRKNYTF